MAETLKRAQIDFTVYEKAGEVGGTWRDNTFPGLFVDVLSRQYEFPLQPDYNWSRKYAPATEIWIRRDSALVDAGSSFARILLKPLRKGRQKKRSPATGSRSMRKSSACSSSVSSGRGIVLRGRGKGESVPMTLGQALAAKVARLLRCMECGAREADFLISGARP
jgi:hypothetical protein